VTANVVATAGVSSREVPGATATPWRGVAGRYLALAATAVAVGALHLRHRPGTLCLFRELTGLPCPFCGGTTAAAALGHGHLGAALAASPLAVGVFVAWPWLGTVTPPRWLQVHRNRMLVLAVVLGLAELWQLARFGILPTPI
jgi:Protein of unknown function (DUF2752)